MLKIHGDYHMHTSYSDGKGSVMDMVRVAQERGLKEIAITDHSFGKITKGLRKRYWQELKADIIKAREIMPVLLGVEANLATTNGQIDIHDDLRSDLDIVLFGVHVMVTFSFRAMVTFCLPNLFFRVLGWTPKSQIRRNTRIVKRVLENNHIDIYTHPSRYFKVDVLEVASICKERGILIELNSKKISFRPVDFERMSQMGCSFIIGSDAHSPRNVGDFTRVQEFLKNCDYDKSCIINLNKTFTEYKNEQLSGGNQNRNTEFAKPIKRRSFWNRWF